MKKIDIGCGLAFIVHFNPHGRKTSSAGLRIPQFAVSFVYTGGSSNFRDWKHELKPTFRIRLTDLESLEERLGAWLGRVRLQKWASEIQQAIKELKP